MYIQNFTNCFILKQLNRLITLQLLLNHTICAFAASACKSRWISLRDQLRKVVKKNNQLNEEGKKTRIWKFENAMSFIIPLFKRREPKSLLQKFIRPSQNSDEESNDIELLIRDANNDVQTVTEDVKETISQIPLKCIKIVKPPTGSKMYESKEPPLNDNSVDLFLNGIAATVKKFSPEYQHMAKSKIFTIVSDLEWEYLQEQKSTN